MMGIGIGVDYTLLMVTRFREWRAAGLDERAATVATLDTAGRSVMVAGTTVVISMMGLFAMGLSFMRGAALVTILAVLVVMAASVTLFPALLGYLGRHVDRLRLPLGRRRPIDVAVGGHVEPSRAWLAWSRAVDRHRWIAATVGVVALLALASPYLDVRYGFPDAGNNTEDTQTRQAYDLLADGFGPGMNGPLLLVTELPSGASADDLGPVADAVRAVPGVASVADPVVNPAGDTAIVTVVPTAGPQAPATEDLVTTLRDSTLPAATQASGLDVHVGGVTATSIDSTDNISKRIPLLIGGVVLLSMLVLLLSFRSVAVVIKAAAMNLLSVAAAYGVVALVLQGGWAGQLIGIDTETPLPAFVPVLMFAVLFGLSMDYEVFLVSRMREAWLRTRDNERAVARGPRVDRPGHHGGSGDHDCRLRGLHPEPGRGAQGDRRRHGRGDPHRRDGGPAAAGARRHAPARPGELVGCPRGWTGGSPSCTSRAARRSTCPASALRSRRRCPPPDPASTGSRPVQGAAWAASCVRLAAPVFASSRATWWSTVRGERKSRRAISALVSPSVTRDSTSASRAVTPTARSRGGTRVADRPRRTVTPAWRSRSRQVRASASSPPASKPERSARSPATGSPQPSASAARQTSSRRNRRHHGCSASSSSPSAVRRSAPAASPERPAATASA